MLGVSLSAIVFYPGGPVVPNNLNTVNVGLLTGLLIGSFLLITVATVTLAVGIWLYFRRKRKTFKATTGKCMCL